MASTGITSGFRIETSQATGEDWFLYMNANDDFIFRNDGSDYVTLQKNTGNVGIGSTTPGATLDVGGHIWQSETGSSVFIGAGAGENDDLSTNLNVFVGNEAGNSNISGQYNVALGYRSLNANISANNNSATGYYSLYNNTIGHNNSANGYKSLYFNTSGYRNSAHGSLSLYSNKTGDHNTAVGCESLYYDTTGGNNTAVGYRSLYSNTTGHSNLALGIKALYNNTSKSNLVAIGDSALFNNGVGATLFYDAMYNTAVGSKALFSNTTGRSNTAYGFHSLYSNTTGNYNAANGYYSLSDGTNLSNSTAIGYDAEPGATNTIRLGNNSVSTIGGYANWTNVSDIRFKAEIKEDVPGLDFILKLRPITYHLDMDAIAAFYETPDDLRLPESEKLKATELQIGFVAQEVEAAASSLGFDFHGVDKPKNDNCHYGLRYAEFVAPLVKAVQEQQEQIQMLLERIEELESNQQ